MSRSCVVVGAGPAGLSAAYRLANGGLRVTVLESEPAIGGRTRSEHLDGFVLNTGAGFVTSFFDATLALLRELHVEPERPGHEPSIVATPFGKLPLNLGSGAGILRFPLVSPFGKLRTLATFGRVLLNRRSHVADLAAMARMDRGGTVERWGRRALGKTAYDYVLRSGIEPFFYFGADEVSAALGKALLRHAVRWDVLVLPNGTGSLCDALAERLKVRTGCAASRIEVGEHGVVVQHTGGRVEADYAVLAMPAPAIARLEGNIPERDRNEIAAIHYVPNIAVFFGYERPVTVQYPCVTPAGPGRHPIARVRTLSHWVRSYVPEGKELIVIHASGWRSAELLGRDTGKIVAALRADAEEIFGRMADPDWIRVYPRSDAIVVPPPRHFRRMQALHKRMGDRLFYAGDWLTGSTIEGAVRTGMAAAERVLAAEQ
jgi:protoporphyrinogen/coproporphyrinogen III oxidase